MQSWNTKTDVFWCSWVSKTKWEYSRSMYFVYFIHSVQSMQCRVESFANCRGYLVGLLVTHCWVYTHPAKYLFFLWTLCQTIHRDWCPSFVTYKWKYFFIYYVKLATDVYLLTCDKLKNTCSFCEQYPKLAIPFVTAMRHIFCHKQKQCSFNFHLDFKANPTCVF